MMLFHFIILSILSCGFDEEDKSDVALAADLTSGENPASNPADGDNDERRTSQKQGSQPDNLRHPGEDGRYGE